MSEAKETIEISRNRQYCIGDKVIKLPEKNYEEVITFSPDEGKNLVEEVDIKLTGAPVCKIKITNEDSFQAARRYNNPMVMNFANAHNPGGGFLWGAKAQEEALCRCSTLYISLVSEGAKKMYAYNNLHFTTDGTDYMMLTPNVQVFRNEKLELLEENVPVGVVTIAAPIRPVITTANVEKKLIEMMTRRIRIMLSIAVKYGYKNLVLGAWGCGVFRNNPNDVAGIFKKALFEEGYGEHFDEVCFAIYGSMDGENITAFKKCFEL